MNHWKNPITLEITVFGLTKSTGEWIYTQLIKAFELLAFDVSAKAFGYGAFHLFRKGKPKYFQLFVCAAGCYMLEELRVIVNSLLGSGSRDGLVTVRLFGFFGMIAACRKGAIRWKALMIAANLVTKLHITNLMSPI